MLNYSASGLTAFTWVCLVIDILAVILRFWSRAVSPGVRFALDDWLALASVSPQTVITGDTRGQYSDGMD